ncbi:ABC transporter substrate-binding protein [Marinovum algicola]|jgi:multiple sugar transport system substrate-binding protein|uniref:ABC transporter substrate-binding protein n=1 Tax=Marinovum algicola TaxID=42444 RepID=UPI0024BA0BBA|nr:extracellular solute-binding protein [Marinovum algicola]
MTFRGRNGTVAKATMWSAGLMLAGTLSAQAQDVVIWGGFPELADFYERVAEGMSDEYPDLNVIVEPIGLRDHEKRVALGLSSGLDDATVLELIGSTANRYIVNDLLPPAPDDIAEFVNDAGNFEPFFRDTATVDGTVYGVPLFRGQGALFYNTDMLAEAGLDGPPTTMEEYDDYAAKLTQRDADGNPTVSGWSLRLSGGGGGIAEKFWINMHQFGGALLEPVGDKYRAAYANEAGLAALRQYVNAVSGDKTVTIDMPADAAAFQRGQTAMFIRESWVIGDTEKKAPELNYDTALLPRGSIALPVNLYVSGGSDAAQDAAWAFAIEANKPEHLIWLLDNVGWLPNRAGVDYSGVIEAKPQFSAFVDLPEDYDLFTLPSIEPINEILTRFAAVLTEAFADPSLAGDDAAMMALLESAEEETNAILDRAGILAE